MTRGCVHIRIENGRIINVFSHLTNLPIRGVIHLSVDYVLSDQDFLKSHWSDRNELTESPLPGVFDLGTDSI